MGKEFFGREPTEANMPAAGNCAISTGVPGVVSCPMVFLY